MEELEKQEKERLTIQLQVLTNWRQRQQLEQKVCVGVSTEELERLGTSGVRYLLDNQKAVLEYFSNIRSK